MKIRHITLLVQRILICIFVLSGLLVFTSHQASAFTEKVAIDASKMAASHQAYIDGAPSEVSGLGASKIVPSNQLYVDGTEIERPDKEVVITTNTPSFSGYTLSNVTVTLTIESKPITRITTTDSNGYWTYNLDQPLPPGTHKLYIKLTDQTGTSSDSTLAATFRVPTNVVNALGFVMIPPPSLRQLDYLTVSLIVFGVVGILIFVYLIIKYRVLV